MPRFFEFMVTFVGLLFLLPFLFVIVLLIKLNSKGSVFYRAERVGQRGKPITIFKFRTMVKNAEDIGPSITTRGDNRITVVGRFLRKSKLDELPQLFNVLKGDMRLVGPRPEDPEIVKKYSLAQKEILKYKPGITSPASIIFYAEESAIPFDCWQETYLKKILPQKISIDLKYFQNTTWLSDMKIIVRTLIRKQESSIN